MIGTIYRNIVEHSQQLFTRRDGILGTCIPNVRIALIRRLSRQVTTCTGATRRYALKVRRLHFKIFRRLTHSDMVSLTGQPAHSHVGNRLRPNQGFPWISGLGKTLWGYYNSPLNAIFVTTNVFAFAGTVAFATFMDMRNHGYTNGIPVYMTGVNHRSAGDIQNTGELEDERVYQEILRQQDKIMRDLRKRIDSKVEALRLLEKEDGNVKRTKKSEVVSEESSRSPLRSYSMESIEVSDKLGKIANYRSVILKASLFNMLYTYKLYEDVINEISTGKSSMNNPRGWLEEVQYLKEGAKPILNDALEGKQGQQQQEIKTDITTNLDLKPNVHTFYQMWERYFDDVTSRVSVNSLENFKLPDWNEYPPVLRDLCSQLYSNKMGTFNDFRSYYNKTNSKKYRKLLALWFYDNCRLLESFDKDAPNRNLNEDLYNEITQDFKNDTSIFEKYASILLNPGNPREIKFFRSRAVKVPSAENIESLDLYHHHRNHHLDAVADNGDDTLKQTVMVPFVSLNTVLNIMEGYINLKRGRSGENGFSQQQQQSRNQYPEKNALYNDKLIRIVQMLKSDVILLQNKEQKNTDEGDLKVQLCDDYELNLLHGTSRSDDGKWQRDRARCYEKLSREPRLIELLKQLE